MPKPLAVTFDAGGTLIAPWPSVGEVYARVADEVGLGRFEAAALDLSFRVSFRQLRLVRFSREEWKAVVAQTFAPFSPQADDSALFEALWAEFELARAWRVFPDVVPALDRLRGAGIRLAVVSNWDSRLAATLRNVGLFDFFETVLASTEVGVPKPAAAVFAEAARRLSLEPGRILHVGDNWREDVEGARNSGFRGVLIERGGGSEGGLTSLIELADGLTGSA